MKKKKGLTLIELLAVIAIIAILFILLIPSVSNAMDKARISGVQTDLRSYQLGVHSYLIENRDSVTEEGLNKHLDKGLHFENKASKELNPWGVPYQLNIDGNNISIDTFDNKDNSRVFSLKSLEEDDGTLSFEFIGFNNSLEKENSATPEQNQNGNTNVVDENIITEQTPPEEVLPVVCTTVDCLFLYSDVGGGIQIDKYIGELQDVIIPNEINGKPVVSIKGDPNSYGNEGAFAQTNINSVVIPNTITKISERSFRGSKLKSVFIPNSVTEIGIEAFSYSSLLELDMPDSVTTLGKGAFENSKVVNLKLSKNLKELADNVFSGNKLISVSLHEGLEKINDSAFYFGTIEEVNIPSTVTYIGERAFQQNKIKEITLNNNISHFGSMAFYGNKLTSLVIPTNLTRIPTAAFGDNEISQLVIPSNITLIMDSAFNENNLTEIVIPSTVSALGHYAFGSNPMDKHWILGNTSYSPGPSNGSFPTSSILQPNNTAPTY